MSDKPFAVNDRRHFTAEGQPRETAPEDEASEPVDKTSGGAASEPTVGAAPLRDERAEAAGPAPRADLGSFCLSLATQASVLLDGRGLPEGASAAEGLQGARSIIAILEMLHDKTEGRRTAEESEILEGVLYELRLAYVARARVTGA
jgi:hypothetical protein